MVPTSPPEVPKPSRTSGESQKPKCLNPTFYIYKSGIFPLSSLLIPLKGRISGGSLGTALRYCWEGVRSCLVRIYGFVWLGHFFGRVWESLGQVF